MYGYVCVYEGVNIGKFLYIVFVCCEGKRILILLGVWFKWLDNWKDEGVVG